MLFDQEPRRPAVVLEEIARVLFWLGAGEILARLGVLPFPGPVIGLVLLYGNLLVRGHLPENLGALADRILQHLGMLFVPAGVGVIAYLDRLQTEIVPILAAVIGGTVVTLVVTAHAAEHFSLRTAQRHPEPDRKVQDVNA
jgi:holin-like protein